MYRAIRQTLSSKPVFVEEHEDVTKYITSDSIDHYSSLYLYNENHMARFQERNTIRGITDTLTNKLFFDFDDEHNLENAKRDAVEMARRLIDVWNVPMECINAYFSGKKGFAIDVTIDKYLTPEEFTKLVFTLAERLPTFDKVVNDANRIIRIPNTRHQSTGLYKIPLALWELDELSLTEIQTLAVKPRYLTENPMLSLDITKIKDTMYIVPKTEQKINVITPITELRFDEKPKFLTNCRWSLQNGFFEEGNRHQAFLCLASTYKNQGFKLDHVYRLLKGVAELQSQISGNERYADEQLYNNVVTSVFSEQWQGGQFTCKKPGWLQTYCEELGCNACSKTPDEEVIVGVENIFAQFDNYVDNLDKNMLTTGIPSLDANLNLMVGTSNALLASPGVGKTSLSLQLLNHLSNLGINSIFYSYDMFHSAVITRMIQRHFKVNMKAAYEMYKDPEAKQKIQDVLKSEYKNVSFCFKSGQSAQEIDNTILDTEKSLGKKIKLVVVDYNELVQSQYADATAASAEIAQALRRIANERQVCVLTLLQPNKMNSTPDQEVTSYNAAKGSGAIAQSVTTMLGLSRPGYNPLNMSEDKYVNITCVKNRNGSLFSVDLKWDGLSGKISELEDYDRVELRGLRDAKKEKDTDNAWN